VIRGDTGEGTYVADSPCTSGSPARPCGWRRASVRSTQALRALMPRFITTWNMHFAHPFEWTYTGQPLAVPAQHSKLLAA
jgi:hypothetical protein